MNDYIFAILFFLPAGLANIAPILANKVPLLNRWKTPIDLGLEVRGKRMLGPNKSWRGLLTGTLAAGFLGALVYPYLINKSQNIGNTPASSWPELFIIGATIGFGALLGDAIESFFKRQKGIKSGSSWLLFDQLDYVFGAIIFSMIFVRLELSHYLAVIVFYFVGHLVMTYLGYLLKLKDKPI